MEAASQTVSLSALVGATQRRILVLHCNGARPTTSSNTLWATTRMALAIAYIFKSTHFILAASMKQVQGFIIMCGLEILDIYNLLS